MFNRHIWKCSRPGWMRLWMTWSPEFGARWFFKVPSNPWSAFCGSITWGLSGRLPDGALHISSGLAAGAATSSSCSLGAETQGRVVPLRVGCRTWSHQKSSSKKEWGKRKKCKSIYCLVWCISPFGLAGNKSQPKARHCGTGNFLKRH